MEKIKVTENSGIQNKWREEANTITIDTIGEFVKRLINDYEHDYGTIVHAISAAVGATIKAMNDSDQGGITGFQAGALMWEILQNEFNIFWPCALIKYEKMLYPQHESMFNAITPEVWDWLRTEATKKLKDDNSGAVDRVKQHWKSIADGIVPFGYRVRVDQ